MTLRDRIVPYPQRLELRTLRALLPRRESEDQRERKRRLAFVREASALIPYLTAKLPGGVFVMSGADAEKLLVVGSRAEFVVLDRAVALVEQRGATVAGRTIVDVGANIGTTSVTALTVHRLGRAVAIEPDPVNVRLLRANAALNELHERIAIVPAAAADAPGTRSFARGIHPDGTWSTGTGRLHEGGTAAGAIEVEALTVDGLVARGLVDAADVALMWLDVQGYEVEALAGARRLLAGGIPLVVAMRPLELSREDGLERLEALLAPAYARFVDLRRPTMRARWRPVERPLAELGALRDDPGTTDLLILP